MQNITKLDDYIYNLNIAKSGTDEEFFSGYAFQIEKEKLSGENYATQGLLGKELYNELIADLDSSNEPQSAKFIALVDGVTYTEGGNTYNFVGIREILKHFVYASYLKYRYSFETGIGSVKLNSKNSTLITRKELNYKANTEYNRGVDLYNNDAYHYISNHQSSFPTWKYNDQSKFLTKGLI